MDPIKLQLLEEIADLHEVPSGAVNIRDNGTTMVRNSSANIDIEAHPEKSGLVIRVKDGTKNESLHIPVIMDRSGLKEVVYNDFYIGEDCDVTIIAGCGIHNSGNEDSEHDGVHSFFVGKNSKVKYVEKHYGQGDGNGKRVLNPVTNVEMAENSSMTMEMVQIRGVDSTDRKTYAKLGKGASLDIHESIMTHGVQVATSFFDVDLDGEDSSANVISRSVAKENSSQVFASNLNGNNLCKGHIECDAIIMDNGKVKAIPELTANCVDASLIHEAVIGKIAGDQLIKLMTLGLDEKEAEEAIVNGFLK